MRKHFVLILIGIIILMIFTFTLQNFFLEQTDSFGKSCGLFFISIFCLFCYKTALNPTVKGIGRPINLTKKYFENKGELHKYQNLCKVLFIITNIVALVTLFRGLCEILLIYITGSK